ncbi:GAF and ANTAR domain-containing protein [Ornithinimicrobium sp. LYQ92]|uniref:GAF and ANTAR domain-containing protein n=1 Tax=Serinicoccus sp. LYQ92 TaxID=3378798 RepID=UPI003851D136
MRQVAREVDAADDLEQAGDRICAAAVELLGGHAEAGISYAQRGRGVENIGATSDSVRHGDALQVELGEGPCLDAAWNQEQVVASDLAHEQRWPRWGPTMVREYGITSMLCTQLFTTREQLGALNIYSTDRDAFDEEAQELARLLAVHAALTVAAAQQVQHLTIAIDRRTTIGKALGIIMVQHDLDDARAFAVLQRLSRHGNRKLYSIAEEVVRTRRLTGIDS